MTDKEKLKILMGALIGNQIAWTFCTWLMNHEYKRLAQEYDAMKKLAVELVSVADETDPRVQQIVSDWQFGTMTRETLSDLEGKLKK